MRVTGADLQRSRRSDLPPSRSPVWSLASPPHHQGNGMMGLKSDEFGCGFEVILRPAGLVVPLGQLVPAPDVAWVDGNQCLHRWDGGGIVAPPGLHPGDPSLEDEGKFGAQFAAAGPRPGHRRTCPSRQGVRL